MLPMSDTPEKAYRTLMDPAYMDKWWRSLDDGVEMVLAVISYVELYSIGNQTEPIEAATEALARRYWDPYACAESCSISGGKIPVRFKWIMRYAQSFKSIATSIHPQLLVGGSPDFAIRMAQSILAYRRMPNYERPWGWFNTQTEAEHDYFKEHFRQQRDTDRSGVYFRVPARGGISDWYVMTRYQQKEHCTEETGNLCGRPMQEQD